MNGIATWSQDPWQVGRPFRMANIIPKSERLQDCSQCCPMLKEDIGLKWNRNFWLLREKTDTEYKSKPRCKFAVSSDDYFQIIIAPNADSAAFVCFYVCKAHYASKMTIIKHPSHHNRKAATIELAITQRIIMKLNVKDRARTTTILFHPPYIRTIYSIRRMAIQNLKGEPLDGEKWESE